MTTKRVCSGCGIPEERKAKSVNLDPAFSLCVDCLVAYVKEQRGMRSEPEPYDGRARAVGSE
jgi:hypothetical protein